MRAGEFVCLMYHDLGSEGPNREHIDASHVPYVVTGSSFSHQISYLRSKGWKACKVSTALQGEDRAVALTFDDGASSDIEVAAPALSYAGFTATFYVVSSWVGTRGYLSRRELSQLAELGFEIGSHSVTHAFLPDLTAARLREEMRHSKDQLEQWIGLPVSHFSCPLGGCSSPVVTAALEAGYASVAGSEMGLNRPGATVVKRFAVRRNTSMNTFRQVCEGKTPLYPRTRQALLAGVKSAIGFSAYSQLCRLVPRSSGSSKPRVREVVAR